MFGVGGRATAGGPEAAGERGESFSVSGHERVSGKMERGKRDEEGKPVARTSGAAANGSHDSTVRVGTDKHRTRRGNPARGRRERKAQPDASFAKVNNAVLATRVRPSSTLSGLAPLQC